MKSIINPNLVDTTLQPMFLGEDLSFQRYDRHKYPFFYNNYKTQRKYYWSPEEVNLSKDRVDFKNLTEAEEFIFTSNLKYQMLLDSAQSRGIPFLTQYVTLPELELAMKSWEFFETLHSESYSWIIQNVYPNVAQMLDDAHSDKEIQNRIQSTKKYYDALIHSDQKSLKDSIYLCLIAINILEGVRFYVSFACAYAMAMNQKMEGNSKIIQLINRDENLHLVLSQTIIKKMIEEPSEGFQEVTKRNEETVYQMYAQAAQEEKNWAEYLFSKGSVLGCNAEMLSQYMECVVNQRMKHIGLTPMFEKTNNPLEGWLSNYTDSKKIQDAPQETEITSYMKASFVDDIHTYDMKKYTF